MVHNSLFLCFGLVIIYIPAPAQSTAQKIKFSINDLVGKCNQVHPVHRKLLISSHLLKTSLIENLIFCAVNFLRNPQPISCYGLFQYLLKTPESHWFSEVFRRYWKRPVVWIALNWDCFVLLQIFSVICTAWKASAFGVILVRIFPHLNWIQRETPHLSVFSPNAGKYWPEKLRIRTLFAQ